MLGMNWKEKIINSQKNLSEVCNCPICGGNGVDDNFECLYCGNTNSRLKEEILTISEILKEFKGRELDNPFIIVSLKKLGGYVGLFSDLCQEDINEAYSSWSEKVLSGNVTELDSDAIFNLLSDANLYQDESLISIRNKVLIDTVTHAKKYSYDVVTGALYNFFNQILKPWVKSCDIVFKTLDENVNGVAYFNQAVISAEDINRFIANGGSSIINTVGHEARHIYQNYKKARGIVENKYDLLMLYDDIVNSSSKDTYDNNYYRQIAEIDARIYGYFVEENFLKLFGLDMTDDLKEQNYIDCVLLLSDDTSRIVEGENVELEDAVLTMLNSDPSLYNRYSQFSYEFVCEGDEVRFKTTQELTDDYLYNKGTVKEQLYIELIGRSKRREQQLQNRK